MIRSVEICRFQSILVQIIHGWKKLPVYLYLFVERIRKFCCSFLCNYSLLEISAHCNMLEFIFVRTQCQLPVYQCNCGKHYTFLSQFCQPLIAEAWNFSACTHCFDMPYWWDLISVWTWCQLPVYPNACP